MNHLTQLIPAILILFVYGLFYLATKVLVPRYKLKKRRSPFKRNFLRSPGEGIRGQVDDVNVDLNVYLLAAVISPLILYSVILTHAYLGSRAISGSSIWFLILIAAAFEAVFVIKLVRSFNQRRKFRLDCEGELAVGRELNQLLRDGYYVYHDFPADNFNIDHIVVGPAGVYAVETKARRKPSTGKGQSDAKVIYDGQKLHFPDWTETKPLEQVRWQAQWLSKWLSSAVGDSIYVQPVIALPGWYVDRISTNDLPVINPEQFQSILKSSKDIKMDEKLLTRIVHQFDQRCREVHIGAAEGPGGRSGLGEKEKA